MKQKIRIMKNLKMMLIPMLFLGFFSTSCSNDDDSNKNIDVIVGVWKITDVSLNGVSVYEMLMDTENKCVLFTKTRFNNDHTVLVNRFQLESTTNDCVPDEDVHGSWEKNRNNYTMTLNNGEDDVDFSPNFINDHEFTMNFQVGSETYLMTLTKE